MGCIEKDMKDLLRHDCEAAKKAGFKPYLLIAKWNQVTDWYTVGTPIQGMSDNEVAVTTSGNITLKAGKSFHRIEAMEKGMIKMNTKKNGNVFETELKIRCQNTDDVRGWTVNRTGERLVILSFELENEPPIILGSKDFYAEIKKDGADIEFGEKFTDDKFTDITFTYDPIMPYRYKGTIDEVEDAVVVP